MSLITVGSPSLVHLIRRSRASPALERLPAPSITQAAIVAVTGIAISALTTTDPLWWHLYFSRLGMFGDISGLIFNVTLVVTGILIASLAWPLRRSLRAAQAVGRGGGKHALRLMPALIVALGVSLGLAGAIPLTVSEFLHERATNAMMLSFAGLLLGSRLLLRDLPRWLHRLSGLLGVILAIAVVLLVTGLMSLTMLEMIAFAVMVGWIRVVMHVIGPAPITKNEQHSEKFCPPFGGQGDLDVVSPSDRRRRSAVGTVDLGSCHRDPATRVGRSHRSTTLGDQYQGDPLESSIGDWSIRGGHVVRYCAAGAAWGQPSTDRAGDTSSRLAMHGPASIYRTFAESHSRRALNRPPSRTLRRRPRGREALRAGPIGSAPSDGVDSLFGVRVLLTGTANVSPPLALFPAPQAAKHPGVGFTNLSVRIKKAALL